ncbi:hypothetical protein LguiB_002978 [Lonicera macranthoides]
MEDPIFHKLFQTETSFMANPDGYLRNERAATLRGYAVAFIENRLLNNERDNEKLFVICCLTIASKMRTKSFRLSRFMSTRNIKYDAIKVMKMELYILNQLEWRMRSLTPIHFVGYFISILRPRRDQISLTHRVVLEIIVASQAEVGITRFKPSEVAASVVSVVSAKRFPMLSSKFEADLLTIKFVGAELSSCKEVLGNLCNSKLEALTAEETTGEVSNSGAGAGAGTSGGVSSSSLPPGGTPRKTLKSKPILIGGGPPAPTIKRKMSSALLLASLPPGATLDEGEIQREPTPSPEYRDDLQMDFELKWTDSYQAPEFVDLPPPAHSRSLTHRLAHCCPPFTTGDFGNRCFIL